ncbi:MAG: DUF58 domain-containing protein [Candidatus Melainabacteria bacterium]|nr:DUF58 domain-containing protein [Candidatus Melainabacteria bacterium]
MWNYLKRLDRDADHGGGEATPDLDSRIDAILEQSGEGFFEVGFRSRSYRTGARRTIYTGPTGDFYKTAEYVRGEHDRRQIMARASAKTGGRHKIVRVCRPDAQTTVYVLADVNRTLDFGSSRESKLELMARCAATICLSLDETKDLIRASLYANQSVVYKMLRAQMPMLAVRDLIANIIEPVTSTGSLDSGFEEAIQIVPASGQSEVVILSDFLNFTDAHYKALADMAQINNVRAIVIQDIRERELPEGTLFIPTSIQVFDMNTGRQATWWLTESNRRKYTAEFEEHQSALFKFFTDNGITYETVLTDEGEESDLKVIGLLASPPLLS